MTVTLTCSLAGLNRRRQLEQVAAFFESPQLHLVWTTPLSTGMAIRQGLLGRPWAAPGPPKKPPPRFPYSGRTDCLGIKWILGFYPPHPTWSHSWAYGPTKEPWGAEVGVQEPPSIHPTLMSVSAADAFSLWSPPSFSTRGSWGCTLQVCTVQALGIRDPARKVR